LEVKDVCYVKAFGNLSRLKDQKNEMHTISSPIGSLHKELDPAQFFRINRSYIVNKSFIESIQTYGKNKLLLKIKGLDKTVMTSTTTTKDFRVWIE